MRLNIVWTWIRWYLDLILTINSGIENEMSSICTIWSAYGALRQTLGYINGNGEFKTDKCGKGWCRLEFIRPFV